MDQVIHVAEAQCDMPLDALDLPRIRQIYNQLADQCLSAVNAKRMDLDDVILEHRAVFDIDGKHVDAEIEAIGDTKSWKRAASQSAEQLQPEFSGPRPRGPTNDSIRCIALRIQVIRQNNDPLAGFAGS